MSNNPRGKHAMTDDDIRDTLAAWAANFPNIAGTARELGISRPTMQRRLVALGMRDNDGGGNLKQYPDNPEKYYASFIGPDVTSAEKPLEDIIEDATKEFRRRKRAKDTRTWMPFKMKNNRPIALVFFGDPHLDECNIDLIRSHVDAVNATEGAYAVGMGDYTNAWSGRLAAQIYPVQEMTRPQAHKMAEWFFGAIDNWMVLIKGNHDCLDTETELFTKRGWIRHDEISQSDSVFSINTENGGGEWSPILEKIVRTEHGSLNYLDCAGINLACTDNHRILHRKRNNSKQWEDYSYAHIGDLSGRVGIPVTTRVAESDCDLTNDELALAGWFLTDGGFESNHKYVRFFQSKDHTPITRLLDAAGFDYTVSIRERNVQSICGRALKSCLPQAVVRLTASAGRRFKEIVPERETLPGWAWGINTRQFLVFFNALMAGDGSWYADPRNGGLFYGKEEFLDQIQALCHMHGVSAVKSKDTRGHFRLNISTKEFRQIDIADKIVRKPYSGNVWCLRVPHGNFMVRREGKIHFTGNCWADKHGMGDVLDWMKRPPESVLVDWQAKFRIVFPNGREFKIWAAHDFPGTSQYTRAFSAQKRALYTGGMADLYITGHKHTWEIISAEHEHTNRRYFAGRARGYKWHDPHADHLGYGTAEFGASLVFIMDPVAKEPRDKFMFDDVEAGLDYLRFLRGKV
jgi:hypothetical protein